MKKYDYYEEKIREAERTLRDFKNRFSALKDEKVKLPLLIEVYQVQKKSTFILLFS